MVYWSSWFSRDESITGEAWRQEPEAESSHLLASLEFVFSCLYLCSQPHFELWNPHDSPAASWAALSQVFSNQAWGYNTKNTKECANVTCEHNMKIRQPRCSLLWTSEVTLVRKGQESGWETWLSWWNACLVCKRPWVPSLAWLKTVW